TFEEVNRIPIMDSFLNGGKLSYPDEPWESKTKTQEGIQAFFTCRSACEKLCQIVCEA
ncbi:hypothetical protein CROQUDRAFT_48437, partial [Cronartium quercuum f. sp. fusiforme G11]